MDYQELLRRLLTHTNWVREDMERSEAVEAMVAWMSCYGGDTTCSLISHYGDNLRSAIEQELSLMDD